MRKMWKEQQRRSEGSNADRSPMLSLALVAALVVVAWFALQPKPGPRPGPTPPGPQPVVGEITHALAIGGPASVTLSATVMEYCDSNGIEYRRTLPGENPAGAGAEFEKLFDQYQSQSPCVGVLSRSGATDRLTIPATADELVVYLRGDE